MKEILLLILIGLLWSCQTEPPSVPSAPEDQTARLTVVFSTDQMEIISRTLTESQEKAVRDVNIYLYHKTAAISKHLYVIGANSASLNLPKGDYDLYVIGNRGFDLGTMSKEELEASQVTIESEADLEQNLSLIMSCHKSVSIVGASTIPVKLKRNVARVNLSLTVAPQVSGQITIKSITVTNAPKRTLLFSQNRAGSLSDVMNYRTVDCSNSYSGSFYLFENTQGQVNSITDQTRKNKENAPVYATYIHIQGYTASSKVDYFIYLGENNTTDFNTFANKQYFIAITIYGYNSVDWRVSHTTVEADQFEQSYPIGSSASSYIVLNCSNNNDNLFYVSYYIEQGTGTVSIDGVNRAANTPFLFMNGGDQKTAIITYQQNGPGDVAVVFSFTDKYGFTIERRLSTSYVPNPLLSSISAVTTSTAYTAIPINLSISELGYTDLFDVRFEVVAGTGTFSKGETTFNSGETVSVAGGSYGLSFRATKTGATQLRFTITDIYGQVRVENVTFTVIVLRISITLAYKVEATTKTISEGGYTGTQDDPLQLLVTATTTSPVPIDISASTTLGYRLRNYVTTSSWTTGNYQRPTMLTIPAGGKSASLVVSSYTGYCMGYSGANQKLLRPGYEIEDGTISFLFYSLYPSPSEALEYNLTVMP